MYYGKMIRDIALYIYKKPQPKPETKNMIDQFISSNDVVLEIGASFGGGTIYLSSKSKFVYSFEPNPTVFSILKRTTRKIKNLKIYNLAVGDKDCSKEMHIPIGDHAGGAAGFYKNFSQKYNKKTLEVKVVNINKIKFDPEPNVLLLDCEGSEIDILKSTDLSKFNKILVEVHGLQKNSYPMYKKIVINLLENFKIIDSDYLIGLK